MLSLQSYGSASPEETGAVLELIWEFQGPGMASEQAYKNIQNMISNRHEDSLALEAFRLHDRIASSQGNYSLSDVLAGLVIASQLNYIGLRARFLGLHASLLYIRGEVPEATTLAIQALEILMDLLKEDPVYLEQTQKTLTVTTVFAASDGNFQKARQLLDLGHSMRMGELPSHLQQMLSTPPVFENNPQTMMDMVTQYLVQRDFYRAVEWSQETERLLLAAGNTSALCKLLGDQAEAFWRLNNIRRAIETYQRAVEYCRIQNDAANASRWHQNLGLIFMERDEFAQAQISFKEAMKAALVSGDEYLIATAMANSAIALQQEQRYQEAIHLLDESEAVISKDPKLLDKWRRNKFAIYDRWGKRLDDEGMVNEAITAFEKGVALVDLKDDQERATAAIMYATLGRLYEAQNNFMQSRAAIHHAIHLFKELGQLDAVSNLRKVLRYQEREGLALQEQKAVLQEESVTDWEQEVKEALVKKDHRTEALARVNLAKVLLAARDQRALAEFERALKAVRQVQDRRGEITLLLNFIPFFLEERKRERALEYANRAVEIAGTQNSRQRTLAFLSLGSVRAKGFHDRANALNAYRNAVETLEQLVEKNEREAKELVEAVKGQLIEAARTALESDDVAFLRRLFPFIRSEYKQKATMAATKSKTAQRKKRASQQTENYPELDDVLNAWRATRQLEKNQPAISTSPTLQEMAALAQQYGWEDVYQRLSHIPMHTKTKGVSQEGPEKLLALAEGIGSQVVAEDEALKRAKLLKIDDDDLPCLCLFCLHDPGYGTKGITLALLHLCTLLTHNDQFASRLYWIQGLAKSGLGQLEEALTFFRKGEARLDSGVDNALRAKLKNEAALALHQLGQEAKALEEAEQADQLATGTGNRQLAVQTGETLAVILMALRRWKQALLKLQWLEKEQELLKKKKDAATTRINILLCQVGLGQGDLEKVYNPDADPYLLFGIGAILAQKGETTRAIDCYTRGFERMAQLKNRDEQEASIRVQYACLLAQVGRVDEAIQQLNLALPLTREPRFLRTRWEIYNQLARLTVQRDLKGATSHAEQALTLARSLANSEALTSTLALLGGIRALSGHSQEAVELIEEGLQLEDTPQLRFGQAEAFTALGRFEEARPIYEGLLEQSRQRGDLHLELQSLEGLAEVNEQTGQRDKALQLYWNAYTRAQEYEQEGEDIVVGVYNGLGVALLNRRQYQKALEVLEQGLDLARRHGLRLHELVFLNNLARASREIGDMGGSLSFLDQALETSRAFGDVRRQALGLHELGTVRQRLQQFNVALAQYQEGLQLARQVPDPDLEAGFLASIGDTFTRLDQKGRSIEYYQRADAFHAKTGKADLRLVDLLGLAQSYLHIGETDQAKNTVVLAEDIANQHGIESYRETLSIVKARVAASLGDWTGAKKDFVAAIEELERLRRSFSTPSEEKQWGDRQLNMYRAAAEAAILASDAASAFEFVECFRVRYVESIVRRRLTRPVQIDEEIWLQYERAADRLAELRARQRVGLAQGRQREDRFFRDAEAEYAQSLAKVASLAKDIPTEQTAFQFPSFENLAHSIPSHCAVISLEMYNEGLGVICAGRNAQGKVWHAAQIDRTFTWHELSRLLFGNGDARATTENVHPLSGLDAESLGWVEGTKEIQGQGLEIWTQTVAHACKILGECVWPTILGLLPADTKRLLLMPGGGFNVLPLHAAQLSSGLRVCDLFTISYVLSFSLLRRALEKEPISGNPILGQIVDPTGDLPFSRVEAQLVARNCSSTTIRSLPERAGTVKEVLQRLQEANIFHFAGHGYFDPYDPMRSRLLCAPEETNTGSLSLSTILNRTHGLRSHFIILSACESGLTEIDDPANEFLGFPGGFLVAGATTILSTLWRVDDLAAALLLDHFVRRWGGGKQSPFEALQVSQNWLRSQTIDNVIDIIIDWQDMFPDLELELNEKHTNLINQNELIKQNGLDPHPFKDEIHWAAFYVTGV